MLTVNSNTKHVASYVFLIERSACTFGVVSIHMENDFICLGYRHDSIVLVYTYVCTVDLYVCLFANKYV